MNMILNKKLHMVLIGLLLPFMLCSQEGKQNESKNAVNFIKVSERIDTSGQPPLDLLKNFKIKNYDLVINLAPPLSRGSILQEGGLVSKTGANYVNIPVDWNNPTYENFKFFSDVLNASGHKKVLVHCQINMRASLFTFLYRVIHDKVDPDAAQEKMSLVWTPSEQWLEFTHMVLMKHNIEYKIL